MTETHDCSDSYVRSVSAYAEGIATAERLGVPAGPAILQAHPYWRERFSGPDGASLRDQYRECYARARWAPQDALESSVEATPVAEQQVPVSAPHAPLSSAPRCLPSVAPVLVGPPDRAPVLVHEPVVPASHPPIGFDSPPSGRESGARQVTLGVDASVARMPILPFKPRRPNPYEGSVTTQVQPATSCHDVRPADPLGETLGLDRAPSISTLPFRKGPSRHPARAPRAMPNATEWPSKAGKTATTDGVVADPLLETIDAGPSEFESSLPFHTAPIVVLTVEQHAACLAELTVWPNQEPAILARYGLDDEARCVATFLHWARLRQGSRELDERWTGMFNACVRHCQGSS